MYHIKNQNYGKSIFRNYLKNQGQRQSSSSRGLQQIQRSFLETISGALSKELLIHAEDVQVLHGFSSTETAQQYLLSNLFNEDVVTALKPYLNSKPDIKIYSVA
ncbi:hypothetical protein [Pedobacter steynii]